MPVDLDDAMSSLTLSPKKSAALTHDELFADYVVATKATRATTARRGRPNARETPMPAQMVSTAGLPRLPQSLRTSFVHRFAHGLRYVQETNPIGLFSTAPGTEIV